MLTVTIITPAMTAAPPARPCKDGRSWNSSTDQNPTYTDLASDVYNAFVTLSDSLDYTDQCCTEITVNPPLSVECDASPNPTKVGHEVQFSCTPSGGVPGYTYSWTFGDGGTSTDQNPTHTYLESNLYNACVTVTDSLDNVEQCCMIITVNPLLSVQCDASPNPTRVGHEVQFSCTPSGGVPYYAYLWTFGDGNTSTEHDPTYTYLESNVYNACVTVTDSLDNVEQCCIQVAAYLLGDANEDGVVDMRDVTTVERMILEIEPPTLPADANEDGDINVLDMTRIAEIILTP